MSLTDDFGISALAEKINRLLERIPQGLSDFKVDTYFEQRFFKEFEKSGYDPELFNRRMAELPLFSDRGKLARDTRLKMEEKGLQDKIDTYDAFLDACEQCKDSTPHAMAGFVEELTGLLGEVLREVPGQMQRMQESHERQIKEMEQRHEREMQELRDELKELREAQREGFVKALDKIGGSAPAEAKAKAKEEVRELTPEEIAQAAKEQAEEQKRQKKEKEQKVRDGALKFVTEKMKGDAAAARALLDGLAGEVDSDGIFRSVDEGSVVPGKLDWQDAYGSKMSEIYILFSKCDMTVDGLRNALRKLFQKKYKK